MPVPSGFLAQTGCVKGWNESAQQSNGVVAPGCEPSGFLSNNQKKERGGFNRKLTLCIQQKMNVSRADRHAQRV